MSKTFYFQDDLKATLTAKNREAKQLSQLEKTRQRNPSDRHIIVSCISNGYKKYFKNFLRIKLLCIESNKRRILCRGTVSYVNVESFLKLYDELQLVIAALLLPF